MSFTPNGFRKEANDFELGFIVKDEECLTYHILGMSQSGSLRSENNLIYGKLGEPKFTGVTVQ